MLANLLSDRYASNIHRSYYPQILEILPVVISSILSTSLGSFQDPIHAITRDL